MILALESSCDDLSVCVYQEGKILALKTASQVQQHAAYGGVVPEIASREHLASISQTVSASMSAAGVDWADLKLVAATYAPGLLGSLLVALSYAKTVTMARELDFVGVHHLEAHLLSPMLDHPKLDPSNSLGLIISGGHSHLYYIQDFFQYQLLAKTIDDAVGEAFDKVAKLTNLGYPGGPEVERLAKEGDPTRFEFQLPRIKASQLDISLSGLKTQVMQTWQRCNQSDSDLRDLLAAFQSTVARMLARMLARNLEALHARGNYPSQLLLSGGVACNQFLRQYLQQAFAGTLDIFYPSPRHCTDNAAMIALVANLKHQHGHKSPLTLNASAQLALEQLYATR